jgi:hypothetical protein
MRTEIRDLLTTIADVVQEINALDKIITNHTDHSVKEEYKTKYKAKVGDYVGICKKLEVILSDEIEREKKENLPITLGYRTIHKKILSVIGKR